MNDGNHSTLVWTPSLELGVGSLDRQHRELFGRLDRASELLTGDADAGAIASPLRELVGFTAMHFDTERRIMQAHGFPDSAAHGDQHAELLNQLRRVVAYALSGARRPQAPKILRFLGGWLARDIVDHDRQLAAFLRARGVD